MKLYLFLLLVTGSFFQASCTRIVISDLETVSSVDLGLYQGIWYEVAKYENSFQKNCLATRANYSINDNGSLNVLNECINKNGEIDSANGTAFVSDSASNGKLKVSFVPVLQKFGVFSGDYWIIELDTDYQFAIIGHPERKYLWILSRKPEMSNDLLESLKVLLRDKHLYSTERLTKTPPWPM
ncbi:MAG TPA: lipocalin family protein [Oligoflexia bacterium]|nr:lipocalin family protein [Oligoflexia bacterium]HMP49417.1 lipocalin family protein [Oligoflexia bacterium]